DYGIECDSRVDVYGAIRAVYTNKTEMDMLEPEDRRLVEKMELGYRRSGLLLPPEERKQLAIVKKQMSDLTSAFSRCLNEEDGKALFTRAELEGLPNDYFDGREIEVVDGVSKFVVTTKYPDNGPLMKYANLESTRKAMHI
ncbi:metalloendopeptidase, partial [Coemansia biformis]